MNALRTLARLLAVLVAVLAGTALAPRAASAQSFLAGQIENLLSTDTMQVKIDGLSGAFSGNIRIEKVTVSDPQGVFLTAENLALDWSPLALVRASVNVQNLSAGKITLLRLPQFPTAAPGSDSGGGGFSLPSITADIQRIAIDEFDLGEPVLGQAARIKAGAKLVLDNDPTKLELNADITRLDQPGQIALNLAFAPADNRIGIDIKASEPAGGLVARLLEIPGLPPVELTVSGTGPLSDFMANGALTVGGEQAAMLTARVQDGGDGRRVTGTLDVTAQRFIPERYATYVGGRTSLDVDLLLRADGGYVVDRGNLTSDQLNLTASGTIAPSGSDNDFRFLAEVKGVDALSLSFGAAPNTTSLGIRRVEGTLAGAFTAAALKAHAELTQAGFGDYQARDLVADVSSQGFNIDAVTGPVAVSATAGSVAAPDGLPERFLSGPVKIEATGALAPGSLTLDKASASTGVASADVSGSAAFDFSTFDLTLSSSFDTVALSAAAVPLAGDRLSVSGHATRAADGALKAENLSVRGEGLTITGNAGLANGTVDADISGALDNAATAEQGLVGTAKFQLTAKGPVEKPDLDLALTSDGLTIGGRKLANLKVEARGAFDPTSPSGSVRVTGTLDGAPLSGTADIATLPNGERQVSNLVISQGPNRISGALKLTEAFAPVGTLDVAITDLGPLAALAVQEASGDVAGRIDLSVNTDQLPVAMANLTSNTLTVAGTTLTGADIKLQAVDYLGKPLPSGTITARGIDGGGAAIRDLTLNLSSEGDTTSIDAKATANGVPVDLAGRVRFTPEATTINLDRLNANAPDARVSLAKPATISIADGVTRVDQLRLTVGDGSVLVDGTAGQRFDLTAVLDKVPAALGNPAVQDLDASGTVSGRASVSGTGVDPNAEVTLTVRDVSTRPMRDAKLPPLNADFAGTYAHQVLTIRQAMIDLGTGSVQATGTVGDQLNLQLALRTVPVALADNFVANLDASGSLSGTATATGALANPSATFDVSGEGITAKPVADAGIAPLSLRLAGRYADRTATLQTAVVNVGDGSLTATGTVGDQLDLQLRMSRIPVGLVNAYLPDLQATGTLSGTANATGSLAQPNATFDLQGSAITARAVAQSGVAPLDLTAAGRFADDTLSLDRAHVAVGPGSVDASGTVGRTLDVKLTMTQLPVGLVNGYLPDLGASGTLSGSASATGTLSQPNAVFDLQGRGITTRQIAASGIAPLSLDAAGRYAESTATIERAHLTVGDGSLDASGTVGQQLDVKVAMERLPVGLVNGYLPDLGARGTLSGSASATGTLSQPNAVFDIKGAGITTRQVAASGIQPLTLDAAGRYQDGTGTIDRAHVTVGAGSLDASGTVGQTLNVKLALRQIPVGLANGFVPSLNASGTLSGDATATGALSNPTAAFDISGSGIQTAQTRAAGAPAINLSASGRYANQTVTLQTARADIGGGSITARGTAGQQLDLTVDIANVSASLAAAVAPDLAPTGSINGSVRATGSASAPSVAYDLRVNGLTLAPTRDAGVGALDITARGDYGNDRVTLDANLSGGGGIALTASGSVGLAGTPQLDIAVNGTAPLALANRTLAAGGRSIQGTVAVNVRVTGTTAAPNAVGSVTVSGGRFVDTGTNVAVNNIAATIALNGRSATIQGFSAQLAAGGTITVSGTVGLDDGFPADIRVQVANGRYNDGELIAAQLNADIRFAGPLTGTPTLGGTVDFNEINVLVPERLPTSLARIDVKHRNAPRAVIEQDRKIRPKSSGGGAGGGIDLDLTLNAPNRVFVRGRGLDIELGGSIHVGGSAASPSITGGFELQRGRFRILARRLDFQRGTLSFTGGLVPTLDLLATADAEDVTVNIAVTGPATDPAFNFSSTPALPQDEVLARLIFGQGTVDLSPLQIAQLAEAAATLAGVGGGSGLLDNLRAQLGVDDLDIKTTQDGQASVGVGKYLNDNTYLGVDSTGRVSLDLKLGGGVKARAAVSATGGGEVGVFYEHEY
ncbi:translocation/assembly module TamB domain-containing protein [Aurantimonas sp. MSK8Z-1]|uniref:translocation/assembly module TamB domain-containing protein n=1 Tax=Mangrovibrevibacter kandeliae TaxID=2968473 RepID=UPI002118A94A|nr:translocation/assembly module TamB domain-containing protein [Aurantimonas sp. MSK8Z-1]MCW4115314.1 translocation/assembly module TamB domain-containing protein [Aurantimonas sp. MSK8Z-1]